MITIIKALSGQVLSALRLYRDHLDKSGLAPAVDLLSDMHAIIRAEYLGLNREDYFLHVPGMRQSFLNFFALHKKIVAEFPKTAERARRIESAAAAMRMPDRARLSASFTILQEVLAETDERYVDPDYTRYANALMKDTATALDIPPPSGEPLMGDPKARLPESEADTWLTMRLVLKSGAFFGKTYRLLFEPAASAASLLGFLETERGKRLIAALKGVYNAVWNTDGDE